MDLNAAQASVKIILIGLFMWGTKKKWREVEELWKLAIRGNWCQRPGLNPGCFKERIAIHCQEYPEGQGKQQQAG